jgi:hypothetical protein
MDIRQKYWDRAKEFAKSHGIDASEHIVEVMGSAIMEKKYRSKRPYLQNRSRKQKWI